MASSTQNDDSHLSDDDEVFTEAPPSKRKKEIFTSPQYILNKLPSEPIEGKIFQENFALLIKDITYDLDIYRGNTIHKYMVYLYNGDKITSTKSDSTPPRCMYTHTNEQIHGAKTIEQISSLYHDMIVHFYTVRQKFSFQEADNL